MLVREADYHIHLALHFLPIDKDIVTSVRNLVGRRERSREEGGELHLIPQIGEEGCIMFGTHHCEVKQAQAIALNDTPDIRAEPAGVSADGAKGL